MRRCIVLLFLAIAMVMPTFSQDVITVTGRTVDADGGKSLSAVSVVADDGRTATVTNAQGQFVIKVDSGTRQITFSHLGYLSVTQPVPYDGKPMKVLMKSSSIMLSEVLVADPEDILRIAIRNIPQNYTAAPMLQQCFYRETTQKGKRFIYVAEAVLDMYKRAYADGIMRDGVAIRKARRLISTQASDTLGAKIAGGPVLPVVLDVMKNLDFLLNEESLSLYKYSMKPFSGSDGRSQAVITMTPKYLSADRALLYGDIYVDTKTMAVTHLELTLDMRDQQAATSYMLKSKPSGVRFKPRGLEIYLNYRADTDGRLSLSYMRSTVSFKCEWRRKLFASPYTVTSEMVVTDSRTDGVSPVKGKDSFSRHESLYDHPEYFGDPAFWGNYNIIAPTQSLEKGISAFMKKNKTK